MNNWLDQQRETIRMLLFIALGVFLVISLVLGIIGIIEIFRVSNSLSNYEMSFDESGEMNTEDIANISTGPSKLGQASSVLGILLLVTLAAILVFYLTLRATNENAVVTKRSLAKSASSSTPGVVIPEETNSCPNCGSSNELEAGFCTYCGEKLT